MSNIVISGYYGFDNFGDETILKILVTALKGHNIIVFSGNKEKTSRQYGVESVCFRDFFGVFRSILTCDYLISGGGNLLQDKTSAKSLLYYLLILKAAQIFKKKTIIFAQGIGPINCKYLRKFTINILKNADYISVRDEDSLKFLQDNGIKNAIKCNDPVWNADCEQRATAGSVHESVPSRAEDPFSASNQGADCEQSEICERAELTEGNEPEYVRAETRTAEGERVTGAIGIQLRNSSMITSDFIKTLAENILKYYPSKEIRILSLQNSYDLDIANELQKYIFEINPHASIKIIPNTSNEKVIADISSLDSLIAMRYHACLIGIKAGIKVLPINYDIKVEILAKEFNLPFINGTEDIESAIENFVKSGILYDKEKINNKRYDFTSLLEFIK